MRSYAYGYTVACLLAFLEKVLTRAAVVNGTIPVAAQQVVTYEEYIVEHDISMEQARNAALAIDLNSIEIPPGCQRCSSAEIKYCQGRDFINDHCCCDKRYHEALPYIPHTCYLGTNLCKPVVGDCSTYTRLRTCCCHAHVLKRWKSSAPLRHKPVITVLLLLLLTTVLSR
ncbi:hypothetical protein ILUMI_21487 [Ignelater luminosus]|uniref:CCC domain-containing protein n=1 Tax=Ignelater luminosus TaxID=2038154 RepID=A0A8K0CC13_IGNLU|nr:hypothetical protein ILUMI_21487 [Ignelater luminosus]